MNTYKPRPKTPYVLDSRVSRLEGVVQTLSREVQDITRAVRTMTDSLGNFKEDVLGRLGVATAPKWPLIASLTMMLLTIFGLCGTVIAIMLSGQSDAINHNKECIEKMQDRCVQSSLEHGEFAAWKNHTSKQIEIINDVELKNAYIFGRLEAIIDKNREEYPNVNK